MGRDYSMIKRQISRESSVSIVQWQHANGRQFATALEIHTRLASARICLSSPRAAAFSERAG